ncbi:LysR family transcriptional regulator [Actinoallomurus purpureus]|uniref:LysR family transcriptional regulator n=1 Tax=Actinoallomurus purpureus TaxID=478114 RepID=UPI002093B933|nr:LysR family transcriptional regulator [Actinoallomurus purpureus]MCO6005400.1 LysR family transcriptional regulator [Actinoallomurus purpureus]
MLDVRCLKSFLAVAQELNITRAAARLHLSQQAVSSHIQQLERSLQLALLVRTSRGVLLTPAGDELAAGGKTVLSDLTELAERVRATAKRQAGTIRLACCPYATNLFAVEVADALEAAVPGLRVDLTSVPSPRQELELLSDGRAHAAFMWLPIGGVGLDHAVIRTDARVAVLSTRHPLADRQAVTLADLAADPVVRPNVLTSAEAERYWRADPRPDGDPPPLGPVVDSMEDCLLEVARGRGIWLAPEPLSGSAPANGNLRWIPVSDGSPFDLGIVWTRHAPTPLIARMVAEVRKVTLPT